MLYQIPGRPFGGLRRNARFPLGHWAGCAGSELGQGYLGVNPVTMERCGRDLNCAILAYGCKQKPGGNVCRLFDECCGSDPKAGREESEGVDLDVLLSYLPVPDAWFDWWFEKTASLNEKSVFGLPRWALYVGGGVLAIVGMKVLLK